MSLAIADGEEKSFYFLANVPKNFLDELRVEINSKSFWTSKGSGRMTVTIGAGKYKVGQDYKEWINFVDKQLYVGKCTGKNKVVC